MQATPGEIAQGADAVVVLSSRIQNDGEFTPEALQRLIRGLDIVRNRQAPVLVLTEVAPPSGSSTVAAKDLARRLQMPLRLVTCSGTVRDTHDEALAVTAMGQRLGWKRLFVVTSPTHTRRAALVFRHAAQGTPLVILPVASQETSADLQTLDRPDERRRAFSFALHERVGLQIYRWRGWI